LSNACLLYIKYILWVLDLHSNQIPLYVFSESQTRKTSIVTIFDVDIDQDLKDQNQFGIVAKVIRESVSI